MFLRRRENAPVLEHLDAAAEAVVLHLELLMES
jgi:hypothetical protein